MTSTEFSFRFTLIIRHSLEYSSITVSILKARPSRVRSWTKSYDHVIRTLRSETGAGALVEPKTAPLPLFKGNSQNQLVQCQVRYVTA